MTSPSPLPVHAVAQPPLLPLPVDVLDPADDPRRHAGRASVRRSVLAMRPVSRAVALLPGGGAGGSGGSVGSGGSGRLGDVGGSAGGGRSAGRFGGSAGGGAIEIGRLAGAGGDDAGKAGSPADDGIFWALQAPNGLSVALRTASFPTARAARNDALALLGRALELETIDVESPDGFRSYWVVLDRRIVLVGGQAWRSRSHATTSALRTTLQALPTPT